MDQVPPPGKCSASLLFPWWCDGRAWSGQLLRAEGVDPAPWKHWCGGEEAAELVLIDGSSQEAPHAQGSRIINVNPGLWRGVGNSYP